MSWQDVRALLHLAASPSHHPQVAQFRQFYSFSNFVNDDSLQSGTRDEDEIEGNH